MDIDPLGDTVPPRHAVESDEEEDEYNPLSSSIPNKAPSVDVKIVGDLKPGKVLFIASGNAGKTWAKGAQLGEQSGAVMVNNIQVGLTFSPKWTQATVIISEVTTRLPIWAMQTYAEVLLKSLKPSSLSLLDVYPCPVYITANPLPYYDAPIRYLRTQGNMQKTPEIQPFTPPNLIQSTSASFLSLLSTAYSSAAITGTLILLPSPHIPPPPPSNIAPTNFSSLDDQDQVWNASILQEAQNALFASVGEKADLTWEGAPGLYEKRSGASRKGDLGEGGMYI